ncbi:MAG: hypothetical protein M3365_10845 [Gemmatimonadota bacterium]|nr:hypothetical protein [Gemmatimonadota bacterium]
MRRKSIGALFIGAVVASCASATPLSEVEMIDQRTTVTVDNQSFSDMTIYASRGQRIRLGTARGKSRTVLTIPSSLVAGITTLHFIADPIGSSRASVSEEIQVSEGDSVELTIPPP